MPTMKSLDELMQTARLPVMPEVALTLVASFASETLDITYMRDVLTALVHMHERGVLYRDLKPSNVMWNDTEGKAIVIDFDVATFWNPTQRHHRCLGTDGYIAPEIISCEGIGISVTTPSLKRYKILKILR